MSYRSYANKTLIQNWYEDRLAPSQPSKLYPTEIAAREKEEAISCLTAAGVPKALNVWKRQQKWNTVGIVPDDGFREMYTINKTEIPDPQVTKNKLSKVPSHLDSTGQAFQTIQKSNITNLTHVDRSLPGPQSGFGAVLPKHPESWEQRHFETTYTGLYGKTSGKSKPAGENLQTFVTTNQILYQTGKDMVKNSAGIAYKPGFLDSGKEKSELLCAEKLRLSEDPQHNTIIQRTWLPHEDAGVKARLSGKIEGFLKIDNENSLPLGTGEYFTQQRKDAPAAYRKIRTDVTTAPCEHTRMAFR